MVLRALSKKVKHVLLPLGGLVLLVVGCQKDPAVPRGNPPVVEKPCCAGGHGTDHGASHGSAGHGTTEKKEADQASSKT